MLKTNLILAGISLSSAAFVMLVTLGIAYVLFGFIRSTYTRLFLACDVSVTLTTIAFLFTLMVLSEEEVSVPLLPVVGGYVLALIISRWLLIGHTLSRFKTDEKQIVAAG